MVRLGERQTLSLVEKTDKAWRLSVPGETETVLLKTAEAPEGAAPGDLVEAFVYKDNQNRLVATLGPVPVERGGIAVLAVKSVEAFGAFLDWGLDKDLFLPFKEQKQTVRAGMRVPIRLYEDKSGRLCASMRIGKALETEGPYQEGAPFWGTVYEINDRLGAFVAVENRYHGLVPRHEIHEPLVLGQRVEGRVLSVREDGKLNLSLREKAYKTMDADAERILEALEEAGGSLPFSDRSDPEAVRKRFGMSKRAFKRGIGRLLKKGLILQSEDGIRKASSGPKA